MWAFFERIAAGNGLEALFSARWIAAGLFMTALGPAISAWLGDRFGRVLPLSLPTLVAMTTALLFTGEVTSTTYAIVLILFPLAYYVSLSFTLSVIADADHNGLVSSLMSFALACGALIGPILFGYIRDSFPGAELWFIVCALGSGIALILWVHRHTESSRASI